MGLRTKPQMPGVWLGERRGYMMDWITQVWVVVAHRRIAKSDEWLMGPFGDVRGIGSAFYTDLAAREQLSMCINTANIGLMNSLADLVGEQSGVRPEIYDFYEHTSEYEMEVTSKWCGAFFPFGWLLAFIFSRRLQQLNVPLSCRTAKVDLTSEVIVLSNSSGDRRYTGWFRRQTKDREVVYAGIYAHSQLPDGSPVLKVIFPLPNGNATVIMRPRVAEDGSLELTAGSGKYGSEGFYFLVRDDEGGAHVRFVRAVRESIRVFVDERGLGAHHRFQLFGLECFRLSYRMARKSRTSAP